MDNNRTEYRVTDRFDLEGPQGEVIPLQGYPDLLPGDIVTVVIYADGTRVYGGYRKQPRKCLPAQFIHKYGMHYEAAVGKKTYKVCPRSASIHRVKDMGYGEIEVVKGGEYAVVVRSGREDLRP